MIVVIDCNVVISAGLGAGLPGAVVEHVLAAHRPAATTAILDEYRDVAGRPKFATRADEIRALVERITGAALMVVPAGRSFGLPDVDDEIYVAAAIAAGADCIVTGNRRHFPAAEYGAARVWSVREFAEAVGVG